MVPKSLYTSMIICDNGFGFLFCSGVQIGFRDILYSSDESSGVVMVGVGVLSGSLSRNITVRLSTTEGTATGKNRS